MHCFLEEHGGRKVQTNRVEKGAGAVSFPDQTDIGFL
jgi:hypothetical protein